MNKILRTLAAFSILALTHARAGEPTAAERLDLLPLPEGAVAERNVDLAKDPALEFAMKHSDFAFLDPFMMQRRKNAIPENFSLSFTTKATAREVFLFYKRFFNVESEKTSSARTLPFYNSRSYFSFDEENEADVTRDTAVGKAAFYRMTLAGGKGQRAEVVTFNEGTGGLTRVFLFTYDKPE